MNEKEKFKKILLTFSLDFCQYIMRNGKDFETYRISEIREFCDYWVEENMKVNDE